MTDQEIRAGILEAAYNAWRKDGSLMATRFNVYEISKDWGVEKGDIDRNADYLHEKGLVERRDFGGAMGITATGIDEYEKKHGKQI